MSYEKYQGVILTPAEIARLERRAEILSEGRRLRENGATLAAIGERYGFTKQRAHRMFADAGISPKRRAATG